MTARIIAIDSDEHRAVQSLLPWFTNGTLDDDELKRVREHIAQCPRCEADAQAQQALHAAAAATAVPPLDVDSGWAALRARIAPQRPLRRAPPSGWSRLGWPMLAGAQAIAVLVLAVVVVTRSVPQGPQYQALGSGSPAAANAIVLFQPSASEAQIRQALRASHARIVDGPTVMDAWLVQLPSGSPRELARLRADPAVSRVESLQGAAR